MTRWIGMLASALLVVALAVSTAAGQAAGGAVRTSGFVARIELSGPIGPAAAEYVDDTLNRATRDGATAIVLQLDTPGGLSDSMRQIIASILAAKRPVLGFVAPEGARAASAGTYILYACHLAAMAPATHLGAATPVQLGGENPLPLGNAPSPAGSAAKPVSDAEEHKVMNDAIAYIRSLAQLNGRNAEWAEQAVRGAATLTARRGIAEARDRLDRCRYRCPVDTSRRSTGARGRATRLPLKIAGLSVRDYAPNWRTRFLGDHHQPDHRLPAAAGWHRTGWCSRRFIPARCCRAWPVASVC